ncbi:MAG: DUF4252 domain-containing protein [Saprospiraceae bacterium]
MKTAIIFLLLTLSGFCLQAQDMGLYWKYKDYDGAMSFSVPRLLIHAGSWFLDEKTDRELLRKVHKVRILAFEKGECPVTDAEIQSFAQEAERSKLEVLLTIRDKDTRFWVYAKERGDAVRKIVVLVKSPEEFGLVSIFGNFQYDDIGELVSSMVKRERGSNNMGLQSANPLNTLSRIRP